MDPKQVQQLKNLLVDLFDSRASAFYMTEVPKGEACLRMAHPKMPEYNEARRILLFMYRRLNGALGLACYVAGQPVIQSHWFDETPLELLAEVLPGIEDTQWYHYHLSLMMGIDPVSIFYKVYVPNQEEIQMLIRESSPEALFP